MDLSTSNIKKPIISALHRYHVVIFAIVALGGLAVVMLLFNNIIIKSGDTSSASAISTSTSFDKDTIDRINQLKTRDSEPTPIDFTNGRTNPFVE